MIEERVIVLQIFVPTKSCHLVAIKLFSFKMDVIRWQLNWVECNFAWTRTCDFKLNSRCMVLLLWIHAYDFAPKCTPLSSIPITNLSVTTFQIKVTRADLALTYISKQIWFFHYWNVELMDAYNQRLVFLYHFQILLIKPHNIILYSLNPVLMNSCTSTKTNLM